MSIFLDTGIFIAERNADDKRHSRGEELMKSILKNDYGKAYTSDYVVDEAITLMLMRTKRHKLATDIGEYVLDSPRIRILRVTEEIFDSAWRKFRSFEESPISFTDCTTLALMEERRIEKLASFDSGFDGLVERIS
ncbi:hypothetical protein AKJ41_02580 [candidate division MSBL1 archaeon SCGC-AAA259O05]|uniref:PIN domain-containing protein n=1 Tax=candidate division MSBL1 archaeon SCGC-AAA259O05 TaxID=1698271 RepID=A0A133V407_9EURY|nr:hypothetical protein AKJ41_02580 [candidate division MSBL1 archaeon SCGC-AAA259O05]